MARALRDAGHEVIYTGLRRTSQQIVDTVRDEDARFLGLSSLSGAHAHLFPQVCEKQVGRFGRRHCVWRRHHPERRPTRLACGRHSCRLRPGHTNCRDPRVHHNRCSHGGCGCGAKQRLALGFLSLMEAARLADELQQAFGGDRRALARVLSKIENGTLACEDILKEPSSMESHSWQTMAITGAPGVGKSVLVDAIMTRWATEGDSELLSLRLDPSSPRTGGVLL